MIDTHSTNRNRRRTSRARLLIAGVVLAGAASVTPTAPTAPAGAWGSTSVGCGATGTSGLSGGSAVATTTGSTCGSNWVRFNFYWGGGDWRYVTGSPATLVENPHLYAGGGGHKACGSCSVHNT